MKYSKFITLSITMITACMASGHDRAEALSLAHGRSADVSKFASWSLDGGFGIDNDHMNLTVRINRKVGDRLLISGHAGLSSIESASGYPLGMELQWETPDLIKQFNSALKLSAASGSYDFDQGSETANHLALELVLSKRFKDDDLGLLDWYATLGLSQRDTPSVTGGKLRVDKESLPSLELGIVYPAIVHRISRTGPVYGGDAFFSLRLEEAVHFVMGLRYLLD